MKVIYGILVHTTHGQKTNSEKPVNIIRNDPKNRFRPKMNSKTIKRIQILIGILLILTHLGHKYSSLEFDLDFILWLLVFSFLIVSIFHMITLKPISPEFPNSFFPYRSTFIGVDRWFEAVFWILLGATQMATGEIQFGLMLVVLWLIIVIEKIVENRKKLFNVEFKKDRIVINENSSNEIMFGDIAAVEVINPKKIKLKIKDRQEDAIMNINRIARNLREEFKSQLLGLEKKITKSDNSSNSNHH